MLVARRILWKNKQIINFICTTNSLKCDDSKVTKEAENSFPKEKKQKNKQKAETSPFASSSNFSTKGIPKKSNVKNAQKKSQSEKLPLFDRVMQSTVKSVAKTLKGDPNKTTEEILNYLKDFEVSKDSSRKAAFYENEKYVKFDPIKDSQRIFTLACEPLNIFDPKVMAETEVQVKLKIWDDLEAEHMAYLSKFSPKNCFEEMINWTNEGKLWHFPIDNDQGMEKEAEISFTEHIFMEQHLEPWCPKRGPLRRFMELVLIGLSKNHHYTVEEKKAHIDWFRKYFEEKKKLLQELGAMGPAKETKEIET